jgi:hypothetical protein
VTAPTTDISLPPASSPLFTDSHTELTWPESESYVTTDGQSASQSWNKAPIWGLRPDFYYCQTVAGLLMWGALSDERTGLSFTIAAGPRQRSHSRVRVLWNSHHILLPHIRDFPFRRLLRLAGSRWKYSTPPSHRSDFVVPIVILKTHRHGPSRKPRFQQYLYFCASILCSGDVFTKPLLRNGSGILNLPRCRCIVTALHATGCEDGGGRKRWKKWRIEVLN